MKKFTVIGNPINHSLSPQLHNWIFKKLNINAIYNKTCCFENTLPQIINKIKTNEISGINITIPFKEKIIKFLDEINIKVELIGSVNCVIKHQNKIIGYNTDWYGFSQLLDRNNIDVYNKEIIIIGAGGSAKAVIYTLMQRSIKNIRLFNRTLSKAQQIENSNISAHKLGHINNFIKNNSIIINCTSLGMQENMIPFNKQLIHMDQIIIDTIYNPYMTELLKIGNQKGSKVVNGLDMLIYQGIASLELWLGEPINESLNFMELKKYLKELI